MNELFRDDIVFNNHDGVNSRLVVGQENEGNPIISVIMPVYNHPDFLEESLLSVINQEGDIDYEIVIIDNNHPTFQKRNQLIVEKNYVKRLRYYVNEENIGGVGSENRGIALAKGKYITFCHDDDLLYDDALMILLYNLSQIGKEDVAIFGNMTIIDENGNEIPTYDEFETVFLRNKKYYRVKMSDFLLRNYTNGCGSLYTREGLIKIGGFREEFIPCPDYALNSAYAYKYGSYALRKKTLKYRMSPQGDSSTAYKHLVESDSRVINSVLPVTGFFRPLHHIFIKAHLRVIKYHLYKQWSGESDIKRAYASRILNRVQMYAAVISKCFR